jgi:hypothetical protein
MVPSCSTAKFCRVAAAGAATVLALTANALPAASQTCVFLQPLGVSAVNGAVSKSIGLATILPFTRANWNTDFVVTQPYKTYKLFFTANSSDPATYPVQAFLKFTDGSNLQVVNESLTPKVGTGQNWVVPSTPGKLVSQVSFRIGDLSDPAATGFSYRIAVQGCN